MRQHLVIPRRPLSYNLTGVIFLTFTLTDLRTKEIVDTKTGVILGRADDIRFDAETSNILSIIIYGRPKLFGFLGRDADIAVKFEDVSLIGKDAILVRDSEYLPNGAENKDGKTEKFF